MCRMVGRIIILETPYLEAILYWIFVMKANGRSGSWAGWQSWSWSGDGGEKAADGSVYGD